MKLSNPQVAVLVVAYSRNGEFRMTSAPNRNNGWRWVGPTSSVLALERRGLLERVPVHFSAFRIGAETIWKITAAGRAALAEYYAEAK